MLAAENAALPGGKIGGMGDVLRDVPAALAARGWNVIVLMPAYGVFANLPGNRRIATVNVDFGGSKQALTAHEVKVQAATAGVRQLVLDSPLFVAGKPGQIYVDDGPDTPFASDASRFALFCTAAAEALLTGVLDTPSVIHLHDWHSALFLALCKYHARYAPLADIRTVYTIHNLAIQGIRPFKGAESAFFSWFPGLQVDTEELADPRWPDCVNPMAVGVRLADTVHAVSPTYADEITRPSSAEDAFFGGEGLEADLLAAKKALRLHGILNGCDYPPPVEVSTSWDSLWQLVGEESIASHGDAVSRGTAKSIAAARPATVLTSVGRSAAQKLRILRESKSPGLTVLDEILLRLGADGAFIMLGSGDPEYETFLAEAAARHHNFVYLRGYSDRLAEMLYKQGDLFLMPSSFEPCGISQMLAMREGQPCLVHGVGGLNDTVAHEKNGFAFHGTNLAEQAQDLLCVLDQALVLRQCSPDKWHRIRHAAAAARFRWSESVQKYETELYGCSND